MSYLLLWLEGPLQSWGADSKYYNRTTLPFPTKSGILGLLCFGEGRETKRMARTYVGLFNDGAILRTSSLRTTFTKSYSERFSNGWKWVRSL